MQRDLTVLCCLPLTRGDWEGRANSRPCGDFVRFVSETQFGGNVRESWLAFSREAGFIERKLNRFVTNGTRVIRCATRENIRAAAHQHCDVVILAHWKNAVPLDSDVGLECDRLECWDEMLAATDLSDLFPQGYRSTAYLAVCTSNIPAETFRRNHPDAICICNDGTVRAGLALAKLDIAIALMAVRHIPLWGALLEAGDIIDDEAH